MISGLLGLFLCLFLSSIGWHPLRVWLDNPWLLLAEDTPMDMPVGMPGMWLGMMACWECCWFCWLWLGPADTADTFWEADDTLWWLADCTAEAGLGLIPTRLPWPWEWLYLFRSLLRPLDCKLLLAKICFLLTICLLPTSPPAQFGATPILDLSSIRVVRFSCLRFTSPITFLNLQYKEIHMKNVSMTYYSVHWSVCLVVEKREQEKQTIRITKQSQNDLGWRVILRLSSIRVVRFSCLRFTSPITFLNLQYKEIHIKNVSMTYYSVHWPVCLVVEKREQEKRTIWITKQFQNDLGWRVILRLSSIWIIRFSCSRFTSPITFLNLQ